MLKRIRTKFKKKSLADDAAEIKIKQPKRDSYTSLGRNFSDCCYEVLNTYPAIDLHCSSLPVGPVCIDSYSTRKQIQCRPCVDSYPSVKQCKPCVVTSLSGKVVCCKPCVKYSWTKPCLNSCARNQLESEEFFSAEKLSTNKPVSQNLQESGFNYEKCCALRFSNKKRLLSKCMPTISEESDSTGQVSDCETPDSTEGPSEKVQRVEASVERRDGTLTDTCLATTDQPRGCTEDVNDYLDERWLEVISNLHLKIDSEQCIDPLLKLHIIQLYLQYEEWESEKLLESGDKVLDFGIVNSADPEDKEIARQFIRLCEQHGLKGKSTTDVSPAEDIVEYLGELYDKTDVLFVLVSPKFCEQEGWHQLFNNNVAVSAKTVVPLILSKWRSLDNVFSLKDVVPLVLDCGSDVIQYVRQNIITEDKIARTVDIRNEATKQVDTDCSQVKSKVKKEMEEIIGKFSKESNVYDFISSLTPKLQCLDEDNYSDDIWDSYI